MLTADIRTTNCGKQKDRQDECGKIKDLIGQGQIYDFGNEYFVGMPHHPNHPAFAFTLIKQHGDIMYEEGVCAAIDLFTTGGHTGNFWNFYQKKCLLYQVLH